MAEQNINIEGSVSGKYVNIGDGTQNIYEQAAKAERSCPPPPENPAEFGGRDDECKALLAKLEADQTSAITAVNGQGGMGKTTLAKVVANRLYADKSVRAVLWADITDKPDTLRVLRDWVSHADAAFDMANQTEQQIAMRVKSLLEEVIAEKCEDCDPPRVLVVLDDVWENGVKTVELLKYALPEPYTLLITTRLKNVANKIAPGKSTPLDALTPDNAVKLLREYLPDLSLSDAMLMKLGHALEGHPLALKLAALRILNEQDRPGETPESTLARCTQEYTDGIPNNISFAALELDAGDDKNDNLTKSLYFSYAVLKPEDQARFRALGVLAFNATFDINLLATLWQIPLEQVDRVCDRLRHLAMVDLTPDTGRYRQNRLLRAYARALLNVQKEYDVVFGCYAEHVISLAVQFRKLPLEAWSHLTPDLPHVDYTGDILVQQFLAESSGDPGRLWRFVPNFIRHMIKSQNVKAKLLASFVWNVQRYIGYRPDMIDTPSGRVRRGMDWLETGLKVYQQQGDRKREAITLNNIGRIWSDLGENRKALDYYEQALRLHRLLKDIHNGVTALVNIGATWDNLGEKRRALDYYQEALLLSQVFDDNSGKAVSLHNIGTLWSDLGEKRKALDYYDQALPLRRAAEDKSGEANTLNNIGGIWSDLGENHKALDYYDQALRLRRAVEDKSGEANTLSNIGKVWSDLGEKRRALDYYQEALLLCRAVGYRLGEGYILDNIGKVWSDLGENHKALDYFEKALPVRRAVGDKLGEANTLNNIGGIWHDLGERRKALDIYEQALHLQRVVGDKFGEATTRLNIGVILYDEGNLDEAIRYLEQCVGQEEQIEHPNLESDRRLLAKWKDERDSKTK